MTRTTRTCSLVWLTIGCGLTAAQIAPAQTLTGLGFLPGNTNSDARGVSGDGLVAVGTSGSRGFRWTSTGGMQDLGIPPGYLQPNVPYATNGDGSVVVGNLVRLKSPFQFPRAFRWSSAGGWVLLGTLPPGSSASFGTAVNGDGSVVVGYGAVPSGNAAFRWTAESGLVNLGMLTGGTSSHAYGVSQDGLTVVGYGYSSSTGINRAFRWTNAGGMENLGTLPGDTHSWANGISADGSTIVGYSGSRAFRWTAAEGMVSLGGGAATASNRDGTVIVGNSGSYGFLWTPGLGRVELGTFLPNLGISLGGWGWMTPAGISADGLTIVGKGFRNNIVEGWIATLGPRCLANCDNSFIPPALNVNDFICFQNRFAAGDPAANCDGSTLPPVLNVSDFVCFLNQYAAGCP